MEYIKPIETYYRGYRFRSRLEAKWAVFLDALDEDWQYEVEGFNLNGLFYLPDFYLPSQQCFIEIKHGTNLDDEEIEKAKLLSKLSHHWVDILCGEPGKHRIRAFREGLETDRDICFGLCGNCGKLGFMSNTEKYIIPYITSVRREWGGHCYYCDWHIFEDEDYTKIIIKAYQKGLSARFEHGENHR